MCHCVLYYSNIITILCSDGHDHRGTFFSSKTELVSNKTGFTATMLRREKKIALKFMTLLFALMCIWSSFKLPNCKCDGHDSWIILALIKF